MLKILTLNINDKHAEFGTWPERRARIETLLQSLQPSIVGLQAVHVSPALNQVADLTRSCSFRYKLFLAATETEPHQGSAILSTIPLSAPWSFALPRQDTDEDPSFRRAIGATFAWQGELWQFTNAHCSWVAEQNLKQIQALTQALQAFPGPQCLVGDFNAPPDSPGITQLKGTGWMDSFAVVGQGDGATFPSNKPESRIDYVFLNGVEPARLTDIQVLSEPKQPLSNHAAVALTLRKQATTKREDL